MHIYITNHVFKKKNHQQKSSIFQQPVPKKVRNLKISGKIFAYLQKQLQKIAHFKKSAGKKKCFGTIGAYLRSQFKQKSLISKNQP